MRLQMAIDLAALWALLGVAARENSIQSLRDQALFETDDGAATDLKGLGNLSIGQRRPLTPIRFEQHAGDGLLLRTGLTCPDQPAQALALLIREGEGVSGNTHSFLLARVACRLVFI